MGAIQQSVNSAISTMGVLAGLYANTPAGQLKAQNRILKGQEKGLTKQMSTLETSPEYQDPDKTAATEKVKQEITDKLQQNRGEQFYAKPTSETLKRYVNTITANKPSDVNIMQQANQRATETSDSQAVQNDALKARFDWAKLSVEERAQMLREGQHIQSQEKRRVQHERYEEGKK